MSKLNLLEPHFNEIIEHTEGTRDRTLDDWRLHTVLTHNGTRYFATGTVITEHGKALPFTRVTETSFIKKREGRTLITDSGSRYALLKPHAYESEESYLLIPE